MSLEIIIENVRVSRGANTLLDGAGLHLPPGGRVALVGGNGAGKSTLLRVARGEIWPDQLPGGGYAGQRLYVVDGRTTPSPIEARPRIGAAGADLRDLYRRRGWNVSGWLIVVSGLTDSPLASGAVGEPERRAALASLERLGIGELAYRPFLELSQGQAMAVLLARAVVRGPEWLFLDEAADGLDAPSRRVLHGVLEALADSGVGLAAATHHPGSLPDLGFEAVSMSRGRTTKRGPLKAVAKALAPAIRREERRDAAKPATEGEPLLALHGATVTLGGVDVLGPLDWRLRRGEHWVVVGRNGAGKSSLVKLLSGDLHPSAGRVDRFGLPEPVSLWDLRARLGVVAWDAQAEHPRDTTVREVLVSGFFGSFGLYNAPDAAMLARAAGWLERLGLNELADRPISSLSQGQARKAMIGRALAFDPQVLLLDEPLGGLDPQARAEVLALLDDLAAQGRQLVMVTHNPLEIPACVTHALVLEGGRAVAAGPAGEALAAYES
ncbi:ATP-binding cassette domain-containing protein [Fundidesulfovibrio soli]|uniref:ATP-binding cassette domain-containing protein n=1 Tax=Fundidesulfovibrio soli TaxID=2922716 RepID=UPI001FAEB159|nr:ATP-binding cassette domain-containing protein [Fundidesulfovibrio soli]